ncbi:hypothetical protein DPMN_190332 [Dreissena polymorpha]|uniref:Uncharacterized protein n=1 Tax=Dreissena polymorpha TaxID=45954 RepID=A0A9D4IBV5_DREPO|nr:hypothetical protein DPMN_190332 [Dreissena polymorpha]
MYVQNITATHVGPQEPQLATVKDENLLEIDTSQGTTLCARLFYRAQLREEDVEAIKRKAG